MTPLTVTVNYTVCGTPFAVEYCAEGQRLDHEYRRALIAAYDDPEDKSLLRIADAAARAYYGHRRKWNGKLKRLEINCPHCRVMCLPRWVGVGSVPE